LRGKPEEKKEKKRKEEEKLSSIETKERHTHTEKKRENAGFEAFQVFQVKAAMLETGDGAEMKSQSNLMARLGFPSYSSLIIMNS